MVYPPPLYTHRLRRYNAPAPSARIEHALHPALGPHAEYVDFESRRMNARPLDVVIAVLEVRRDTLHLVRERPRRGRQVPCDGRRGGGRALSVGGRRFSPSVPYVIVIVVVSMPKGWVLLGGHGAGRERHEVGATRQARRGSMQWLVQLLPLRAPLLVPLLFLGVLFVRDSEL